MDEVCCGTLFNDAHIDSCPPIGLWAIPPVLVSKVAHSTSIYVTALCAAETALAVLDCAMETGCTNDVVHGAAGSLPVGFTTPLHACGDVLIDRIKKAKGTVVRCE